MFLKDWNHDLLELYAYSILEIKPGGLGPRIRDVEAFWYKTEIKIIYFLPLWLIALILRLTLTLNLENVKN